MTTPAANLIPAPTLTTARLFLRAFVLADAPVVAALVGDRAVAEMTLNIPHPYESAMAEEWIAAGSGVEGDEHRFAIVRRDDEALIGAMGLVVTPRHARAELGYWIGRPYWNQGYCTEAGRAVLGYGFLSLGLHRIMADHFARNPASGRVMQKLGMQREGLAREHVRRDEEFIDIVRYAILRQDWRAHVAAPATAPGGKG